MAAAMAAASFIFATIQNPGSRRLRPNLIVGKKKEATPPKKMSPSNSQPKMTIETKTPSTSSMGNEPRPVAKFQENIWGQMFSNYVHHEETARAQEEKIQELKEKVKKEVLATTTKSLEQVKLIDTLVRLGLAYHFEQELEENLQRCFNTYSARDHAYEGQDDLYHTSLCFRVFRQHGFRVPCGIFDKFTDGKGKFKERLISDVEGLLSLYEAAHVRIHNEEILDEAVAFTTVHLKSMSSKLSGLMREKVDHALHQPLHRGMSRLESRYFISMYKKDPSHNKTLLELAIINFNYVQSLHKKEIRDIARWLEPIYSEYTYFAKSRLAEGYFWTLGDFWEPHYALGRKLFARVLFVATIIDDIYDAYATYDELLLFTQMIHRWDRSCIAQLPDYMKYIYKEMIKFFEELEQDLAEQGRSPHDVAYVKKQFILYCDTHMQEAKWRREKCIPPYADYIKNGLVTFGYDLGLAMSFLGMGEIAQKEAFEWLETRPKAALACGIMGRLKNDIGGKWFQDKREHVVSAQECYMNEYGVSEEIAREVLEKQVEDAWKDVNDVLIRPHVLPWPLLFRILELSRAVDVIYKNEDGFTVISPTIRAKMMAILVDPIPI